MAEYKKFESVIIADDRLTEEEFDNLIDKYRHKVIEKYNFPVKKYNGFGVEVNRMGLKKLAYKVKERESGWYCSFTFWATNDDISELDRRYRIDDQILKFINVRCGDGEGDIINLPDGQSEQHPDAPDQVKPKKTIKLMDILLAEDD